MKKELITLADDLCRRANILDGLNPHTSAINPESHWLQP